LAGNHDIPDYEKLFGHMTFSIVLDETVLVLLNNSRRSFASGDLEFLGEQLKKNTEKKAIIMFHIPPPNDLEEHCLSEEEWGRLKEALKENKEQVAYIICGHVHSFRDYELDGFHVIISGGGGAKLANIESVTLKKHHAIRFNVDEKEKIDFKIIPIDGVFSNNNFAKEPA
ncbi:MAG: metallophosphoesterase, partial [Candidatus Omnitrophica bacterium]|nr:metallophosphoesterase [Candidatus Omnitrophota bacterium]